MTAVERQIDPQETPVAWYRPTPQRFVVGFLVVEAFLFLSERAELFGFNRQKGVTVLLAVTVLALACLFLLLWFGRSMLYRRRFQFGIRTLLLFTVVVAMPCSWFAVNVQEAQRQKTAVERIMQGGSVKYDFEVNGSSEWAYSPDDPTDYFPWPWLDVANAETPGPAWLRKCLGDDFFRTVVAAEVPSDEALAGVKDLHRLRELKLSHHVFTATGLAHLHEVAQIEGLNFCVTATDDGVSHIAALRQLRRLGLVRCRISDAALEHIKGLTRLQWLRLYGTDITDTGLKHLEQLRFLQKLDLGRTAVTDAGLQHLKGLVELRELSLFSTKVTDAGVATLQQALPRCKIER